MHETIYSPDFPSSTDILTRLREEGYLPTCVIQFGSSLSPHGNPRDIDLLVFVKDENIFYQTETLPLNSTTLDIKKINPIHATSMLLDQLSRVRGQLMTIPREERWLVKALSGGQLLSGVVPEVSTNDPLLSTLLSDLPIELLQKTPLTLKDISDEI